MVSSAINNQAYLEEISSDNKLLLQHIQDSQGFILEQLHAANLKPSLSFLMENLNLFSVYFIHNHYELTDEQNNIIHAYLNPELEKDTSQSLPNAHTIITSQDIEELLINNQPLSINTIISFEQFQKFTPEIIAQYYIEHENEIGKNTINTILKNSFRTLSLEQIMSIDFTFYKKYDFLLRLQPLHFTYPEYKSFYKNTLLKNLEPSKNLHFSLFNHYTFDENDVDLLDPIFKNENIYSLKNYKDIERHPGLSKILTKDYYFEHYHSFNITDYTLKEVEDRTSFFQQVWLNMLSNYKNDILSQLLRTQCSLEQFSAIVDKDFVLQIFNNHLNNRLIRPFDNDHDPILIKKNFILFNLFLEVLADNPLLTNQEHVLEHASLFDITSITSYVLNDDNEVFNNQDEINEKNKELIINIYKKILPSYLSNSKIYQLYDAFPKIITPITINFMSDIIESYSNPNMFICLLSLHHYLSNKNETSIINLKTKIESCLITVQDNILNSLLVYQSTPEQSSCESDCYSISLINQNIQYLYPSSHSIGLQQHYNNFFTEHQINVPDIIRTSQYNFLDYVSSDFSNQSYNNNLIHILLNSRPEVRNYINNNNISLSKFFINFFLNNTGNKDNVDFLAQYVKLHLEEIKLDERLVSSFLTNPNQADIFPAIDEKIQEQYYQQYITLLNKENVVYDMIKKVETYFPDRFSFTYSRDKLNVPPLEPVDFDEYSIGNIEKLSPDEKKILFVDLYQKKQYYIKEQEAIKSLFSFEFFEKKIESILDNDQFELLYNFNHKRLLTNYFHSFANKVNNSDYDTFMSYIDQPFFLRLLKDSINYDNETLLCLNKFDDAQNTRIAEKLGDFFKLENGELDIKFLYFFAQEKRTFIKKFIIDNYPASLFYTFSFNLTETVSYKPTYFVNEPYTNEEILTAFRNLDNTIGFFSCNDVNAGYDHFFSHCFFPTQKQDENEIKFTMQRLLDFLDFVKKEEPKLYAIMINYHILSSNNIISHIKSEFDITVKTRDEGNNIFFNRYIDIDVLLEGLGQIINDVICQNNQDKISNNKLISSALTSPILFTYYSKYEMGQKDTYHSFMNQEDTIKIMQFLYIHSPTHFLERKKIGLCIEQTKYFTENIQHFSSLDAIQKFIFPHSAIKAEHLSFNSSNDNDEKRLLDIVTALIEHAIENKKYDIIDYFKHVIAQHNFIQRERGKGYYNLPEQTHSNIFISRISKSSSIVNLLDRAIFKINLESTLTINDTVKKTKKI